MNLKSILASSLIFALTISLPAENFSEPQLLFDSQGGKVIGYADKGGSYASLNQRDDWSKVRVKEKDFWLKAPSQQKTKYLRLKDNRLPVIRIDETVYASGIRSGPLLERQTAQPVFRFQKGTSANINVRKISGKYLISTKSASLREILKRIAAIEKVNIDVHGEFPPVTLSEGELSFSQVLSVLREKTPCRIFVNGGGWLVTPYFSVEGFRGEPEWNNVLFFPDNFASLGINSNNVAMAGDSSLEIFTSSLQRKTTVASSSELADLCQKRYLTDPLGRSFYVAGFKSPGGCYEPTTGDFIFMKLDAKGTILYRKEFPNMNCITIHYESNGVILELFEPEGHSTPFRRYVELRDDGSLGLDFNSGVDKRKLLDYSLGGYFIVDGNEVDYQDNSDKTLWSRKSDDSLENMETFSTGPGGILLSNRQNAEYFSAARTTSTRFKLGSGWSIEANIGGRFLLLRNREIDSNFAVVYDALLTKIHTVIRFNRFDFDPTQTLEITFLPAAGILVLHQQNTSRNLVYINQTGETKRYAFSPTAKAIFGIANSHPDYIIVRISEGGSFFVPIENLEAFGK